MAFPMPVRTTVASFSTGGVNGKAMIGSVVRAWVTDLGAGRAGHAPHRKLYFQFDLNRLHQARQ